MRLATIAVLAVLPAVGAAPARAQSRRAEAEREAQALQQTFAEVYELAKSRTVLVRTLDDQGDVAATGSGAVVDAAGYVLTCAHVIEYGARLEVVLTGGEVLAAELADRKNSGDFALLRVPADARLEAFRLGRSRDVQVGDWVLALGHPLKPNDDSQPALSVGRVRAVGGHLMADGLRRYGDIITTDAPIFSGNSGGPLVNLRGELIGLNAAIRTDRLESFSIAIDEVVGPNQEQLQLMKRGELPDEDDRLLHRGYSLLERFFLDFFGGRPREETPAPPGEGTFDRLLRRLFGGSKEPSLDDLLRENAPPAPGAPEAPRPGAALLGARVRTLTLDERAARRLAAADPGVLVVEVLPGLPAGEAGLLAGDLLLSGWEAAIGPQGAVSFATVEELLAFLGRRRPGDEVGFTYRRDQRVASCQVILGRRPE